MKRRGWQVHIGLALGCLAVAALLDAVYVHRVPDIFLGVDFYDSRPSAWRRVISWIAVAVPAVFLPLDVRRPSALVAWVVHVLVVVPTGVLGARSTLETDTLMGMLATFVAAIGVLAIVPRVRVPGWTFRPLSVGAFALLLTLEVALSLAILVRTYGAEIQLVSFVDVYVQRARWMETSAGALSNYAQSWLGAVLAPMLIALGIHRRRWEPLAAGAVVQVFIFSIAAQRGVILAPIIAIGWWALTRGDRVPFGAKLLACAAIAATLPFAFDLSSSIPGLATAELTLNRPFLNNGYLSSLYFDFFSTHPQVHFSGVKGISSLVTSVYPESYKEALSWSALGYASDPNANFVADGFAQLGYTGAMIETLALAGALFVLDAIVVNRRLSHRFVVLSVAMLLLVVVNGQMPNFLLGSGFGLYLIHLAFIPARLAGDAAQQRDARLTLAEAAR